MSGLNYKKEEKGWRVYHRFEQRDKKRFLKKLSASEGFKILDELHQFTHKLGTRPSFKKLDMDKIKTLAYVHSIYCKVKA